MWSDYRLSGFRQSGKQYCSSKRQLPRLKARFCARDPGPLPAKNRCGDFDAPIPQRERGFPYILGETSSVSMRRSCSKFSMHFHVTRTTKRDKVVSRVSSAIRQRHTVVNLFGGRIQTSLQTRFTQRMFLDVPVADSLPRAAISLSGFRVASIVVVLVIICPFMRRAVKLTVLGEIGAARLTARPPWFLGHQLSSVSGQKEKPSISRRPIFLFCQSNTTTSGVVKNSEIQ